MATRLTKEFEHHDDAEEGNPAGTYFAIIAMLVLLALVSVYFWIDHGRQVLASPVLQSNSKLTTHDAY